MKSIIKTMFIIITFIIFFLFLTYCASGGDRVYVNTDNDGVSEDGRGITEPELYRIHNNILYIANIYKGLIAIDISQGNDPQIIGTLMIKGKPEEMYFNNNIGIVLTSYEEDDSINTTGYPTNNSKTKISFIDTQFNKEMLVIIEKELEGYLLTSRVVGDILYVVTNKYFIGEKKCIFSPPPEKQLTNHIYSISLKSKEIINEYVIQGYSKAIHVTNKVIFVVTENEETNYSDSIITYYNISDNKGEITEKGNIFIYGNVYDRFKLDYYKNILRVVSYDRKQRRTILYTINWENNENPVIRGILNLPINEELFATRFSKDMAYVVTFLKKDPLYVIDLSNQNNPKIASSMNDITGWSDHIELLDDKMLAFGYDNLENKIKIEYFNITNPYEPIKLNTLFLGDEDSKTVLNSSTNNYKRLNYLPSLEAYAVPYTIYGPNNSYYIFQVDVIKIEPDTIKKLATIHHDQSVKRTIQVNDEIIYTYSDESIVVHNINSEGSSLSLKSLPIIESLINIIKLTDDIGIKIINDNSNPNVFIYRTFKQNEYFNTSYIGELKVNKKLNIISYIIIDEYLYGLSGRSIDIFDFTDHQNPTYVGEVMLPDLISYKVYDSILYSNEEENFLQRIGKDWIGIFLKNNTPVIFYDITKRTEPKLLSNIYIIENYDIMSIGSPIIHDDILYLFISNTELWYENKMVTVHAYDISNASDPYAMYKLDIPGVPIKYIDDETIITYQKIDNKNNNFSAKIHKVRVEKIDNEYTTNIIDTYSMNNFVEYKILDDAIVWYSTKGSLKLFSYTFYNNEVKSYKLMSQIYENEKDISDIDFVTSNENRIIIYCKNIPNDIYVLDNELNFIKKIELPGMFKNYYYSMKIIDNNLYIYHNNYGIVTMVNIS